MQEGDAFLRQTPLFTVEQTRKCDDLQEVSRNLKRMAEHFAAYDEVGRRLCTEINQFNECINNMEDVRTDEKFRPLTECFGVIQRAFKEHFDSTRNRVVKSLNGFVETVEGLAEKGRDAEAQMSKFNSAEERYIVTKGQSRVDKTEHKADSKMEEAKSNLRKAHKNAVMTSFEFSKAMENAELQLGAILPQMFLSYVMSVTVPFHECCARINDKADELNVIADGIPDPETLWKGFKARKDKQEHALIDSFALFWQMADRLPPKTSDTVLQGYLWRRRSTGIQGWNRKFFMLNKGCLSWCSDSEHVIAPKKSLDLRACSIVRNETDPQKNSFTIHLPPKKGTMILKALTVYELERWLAVIHNSLGTDEHSPDNGVTVCGDCGAEGYYTWCSLNWGLTLCQECAGEHRHIGAKYSQPRSVAQDNVTSLQRALLAAIGSAEANKVLEENVGDNKITCDATEVERSEFIRRKYVDMEFVSKTEKIDITKAIEEQDLMAVFRYVAMGGLRDMKDGEFTPMHTATVVSNPLILHLICLNAAHHDYVDEGRWTPLCYATFYQCAPIVDVLLVYTTAKEDPTVSPYRIAMSLSNDELMARFKGGMGIQGDLTRRTWVSEIFTPPHVEVHQHEFVLGRYVKNPNSYLVDRRAMGDHVADVREAVNRFEPKD